MPVSTKQKFSSNRGDTDSVVTEVEYVAKEARVEMLVIDFSD